MALFLNIVSFIFSTLLFISCVSSFRLVFPDRASAVTGSEFYKKASAMNWKSRDSLAKCEILKGNLPNFLKKFIPVSVSDGIGAVSYTHLTLPTSDLV